MPSSSHVLDEARSLLKSRLAELDEERKRLERALSELGGKVGGKASAGTARRGRPPKRAGSTTSAPRRRRRRRNTRGSQAVKLVQKSPGTSAAEIAKAMKIKPNYLYRVLSELEKEGQVKKQGRKYFPAS